MRQEETVETDRRDVVLRYPERESDQHDEQDGDKSHTTSGKHDTVETHQAQQEQSGQWPQGKGKSAKPRGGMVGLRTLITLTGVDDKGTRQHHLRQPKGRTQCQALHQHQPELHELAALGLYIIE